MCVHAYCIHVPISIAIPVHLDLLRTFSCSLWINPFINQTGCILKGRIWPVWREQLWSGRHKHRSGWRQQPETRLTASSSVVEDEDEDLLLLLDLLFFCSALIFIVSSVRPLTRATLQLFQSDVAQCWKLSITAQWQKGKTHTCEWGNKEKEKESSWVYMLVDLLLNWEEI